jgi:hypothetical protein
MKGKSEVLFKNNFLLQVLRSRIKNKNRYLYLFNCEIFIPHYRFSFFLGRTGINPSRTAVKLFSESPLRGDNLFLFLVLTT